MQGRQWEGLKRIKKNMIKEKGGKRAQAAEAEQYPKRRRLEGNYKVCGGGLGKGSAGDFAEDPNASVEKAPDKVLLKRGSAEEESKSCQK